MLNLPALIRTSLVRCPKQPKTTPKSFAIERIYVPFEQVTDNVASDKPNSNKNNRGFSKIKQRSYNKISEIGRSIVKPYYDAVEILFGKK